MINEERERKLKLLRGHTRRTLQELSKAQAAMFELLDELYPGDTI